ncbi:hypothetical protein OKW42_001463 [Paraburkholderia sp. WC7.3d]
MAQRQARQQIPVELSEAQCNAFVLPDLPRGRRGPLPRLPLYRIFNYIPKALYLGCQWHMLPIDRNQQGRREIHPTSIYRIFRRWQASGCFDAIFLASVRRLQQDGCSICRSFTPTAQRLRQRKAGTISVSVVTKNSRAARSWLSVTGALSTSGIPGNWRYTRGRAATTRRSWAATRRVRKARWRNRKPREWRSPRRQEQAGKFVSW